MKRFSELLLVALLVGLHVCIYQFLGQRVLLFALGLSAIWFVIAMVLLARPPGIPEFVSDEVGSDEQHVIRKDVIPRLPPRQRLQISLSVACGACFLLWLSLGLLRA